MTETKKPHSDVEPQSKACSCNFAPPCLLTQLSEKGSRSSHCLKLQKVFPFSLLFSLCFICTIERKVSVEFLVPLLTIFCISYHLVVDAFLWGLINWFFQLGIWFHQSSLVTDLFIFEVTLLTKEYHHFHLFLISSLGY
ncbi:hypothetical protein GQ457_11G004130 [Hibiscus cannabinus]